MTALLRDYFRRRRFWIGAGLLFCLISAPATAAIGLNVAGVVAVVFAFGSFVGEVETTSVTLRRTLPCTRRQIGLAHWTTSVVLFAGIAAFAEFIAALLASNTLVDAAFHAADRAVSTAGVSALAVLGFSVLAKKFTL